MRKDDIVGLDSILPLLKDSAISEIMINGPGNVYVERNGKLQRTDITLKDEDDIFYLIERILDHTGKSVSELNPFVDARLPDGSRVNIIIPPLSLNGPVITIRRSLKSFEMEELIQSTTLTKKAADFLIACIKSSVNIIVSGGTTTGKTTLLGLLANYIPQDERVILIENTAELSITREHLIRLQARPPNIENKGEVTIRDLVRNALRMRPDRILLGEARGGEALDMIQAMHTGHEGFITVIHANSPMDSLERLQTLMMMSGIDIPFYACRAQIASTVDVIIQLSRFPDGSRHIIEISQVAGMDMDRFVVEELFTFDVEGTSADGTILGELKTTGITPKFSNKIKKHNVHLEDGFFNRS